MGLVYSPSGGEGPYVATLSVNNVNAFQYGYSLQVRSRTEVGSCPVDPTTWPLRPMWDAEINNGSFSFVNSINVAVGSCHGAAVVLLYNGVEVPGSVVTTFINNIE